MTQSLQVSGFSGHLAPLNGTYAQSNQQHQSKVQFSKPCTAIEGCNTSWIYFWDDRDGPSMNGWWIAPVVGGEQVWAFNPSKNSTPPPRGWRVPWHEEKPDANVQMSLTATQPAGQKRSLEGGAASEQAAKLQKTGANGKVAGPGATGSPNQAQNAAQNLAQDRQLTQQRQVLNSLTQLSDQVEKAVGKLKEADVKELSSQKTIREAAVAQNAVNSLRQHIEKNCKQHGIQTALEQDPDDEATAEELAGIAPSGDRKPLMLLTVKLTKEQSDKVQENLFPNAPEAKDDPNRKNFFVALAFLCNDKLKANNQFIVSHQRKAQSALQKKFENLNAEVTAKCDDLLMLISAKVEETKDETVVLTCELGEHSSPEEILKIVENADAATGEAKGFILELKNFSRRPRRPFAPRRVGRAARRRSRRRS